MMAIRQLRLLTTKGFKLKTNTFLFLKGHFGSRGVDELGGKSGGCGRNSRAD